MLPLCLMRGGNFCDHLPDNFSAPLRRLSGTCAKSFPHTPFKRRIFFSIFVTITRLYALSFKSYIGIMVTSFTLPILSGQHLTSEIDVTNHLETLLWRQLQFRLCIRLPTLAQIGLEILLV